MNNWLLIRGLAREKRHWGDFPILFEHHFPGSKVFMIELPGVGEKRNDLFPWSIEEVTLLLRTEFNHFFKKDESPWSVFGVSMGGMIALKWCELFPSDFKNCIVVNTSSKTGTPPWKRMQPDAFLKCFKIFFETETKKREDLVLSMVSNLEGTEKETLLKKWVLLAEEKPMRRLNFLRQLIAAARFKVPDEIRIPLLVLYSIADHMVNPESSKIIYQYLAQKPQHLIEIMENKMAGHDLVLDDPMWVLECLKKFLKD